MLVQEFWLDDIIQRALQEDIGLGDLTTNSLVPLQATTKAYIYAKEHGILAGGMLVHKVFSYLDKNIKVDIKVQDGGQVKPGQIIAEVEGSARAILTGERLVLNLLQRLSGIATKTNHLVKKIAKSKASVVDTRKTTPGLRALEKYAVTVGGGKNHRFGLYDAVMIKDNHIKIAGGISKAVESIRKQVPHTVKIEVEVEGLEQVQEAIEANADIIMLDNMEYKMMAQAVKLINGNAIVEASGNVSEDTIEDIAATGVDVISVGSITHSVKALDISLDIKEMKLNQA